VIWELDSEKNFRVFVGISAGIHFILLFSLINFTLPSAPAQFLEVSLIEIGEPNKPPGPIEKAPPVEELQPHLLMAPVLEKKENERPVKEELPTQAVQQVSLPPSGSAIQQHESFGGGGEKDEAIYTYLMMIKKKFEAGKKYPRTALEKGEEGEIQLKFKIFPDGNVKNIVIIESSGSASLDKASVELVESVSPFLPPPRNYSLSIKIPIKYEINR